MCGINGFVNKSASNDFNISTIKKMNTAIIHRGPDDNGYYCDSGVALGMQRLAIIDLVAGKQPISDDTNNYTIIFNGEIYNYKNIREQLIEKGHEFKTHSDTEVLLNAYIEYGIDCLEHLNGMFAFCIYDKMKQQLFIARDRLGEKPLFYYKDQNKFVFASELKSIIKAIPPDFPLEINKRALNAYFRYTFIPSPLTIYKDIYKLEPGHYLTVNIDQLSINKQKYWDIKKTNSSDLITSYEEAKRQVFSQVNESVKLRLVSDVPLGVFLSGGVDSSIVAYSTASQSSKKIKTFSIGFKNYKAFDETLQAKNVANYLGTDHMQIDLDFDDLEKDVEKVIANFDEPFADSSALPTYWVSKSTANYVKVALTGDGGDEAFGGYNRYLVDHYNKKLFFLSFISKKTSRNIINLLPEKNENRNSFKFRMLKIIDSYDKNLYNSFFNIISLGFSTTDLDEILTDEYRENDLFDNDLREVTNGLSPLNTMRTIDRLISLDGDMCVKVDRASMLASLECRSPFLDHNIFELTAKFPDNFLLSGKNKKRILKDSFENFLPPGHFTSPKSGFGVPVGTWFRKELKDSLLELTRNDFLQKQKIFNAKVIDKLVNDHLANKADHTFKLWSLYCFQKWYSRNLF